MRIITKRIIFEDGSIGYMQGPEGGEQDISIDGNPIVHKEEIRADRTKLNDLIEKSKDRVAIKDKAGRFIIKDKKDL